MLTVARAESKSRKQQDTHFLDAPDYLELVDGTGRVIRADKRGFISGATPAILERLNIDPEEFIQAAGRTLHRFGSAIGTPEHLTQHCVARNLAYLRGIRAARALFALCAA